MKATKAVRRLTKIEASMSDVIERYVTNSKSVRRSLQDGLAAVVVAREALRLEQSSASVTNPPVRKSESKSKTVPGLPKAKRKVTAPGSKEAGTELAKATTKKVQPVKKTAVKNVATKKMAQIGRASGRE